MFVISTVDGCSVVWCGLSSMSSGFSCRRCAEILRTRSHELCEGCCRKLHLTCSGLAAEVYSHLRRTKKEKWACVLCSTYLKNLQEASKPSRPVSIFALEHDNSDGFPIKRSSSAHDLALINSISETFDNILIQLREMKSINANIDNHIKKLAESENDGNLLCVPGQSVVDNTLNNNVKVMEDNVDFNNLSYSEINYLKNDVALCLTTINNSVTPTTSTRSSVYKLLQDLNLKDHDGSRHCLSASYDAVSHEIADQFEKSETSQSSNICSDSENYSITYSHDDSSACVAQEQCAESAMVAQVQSSPISERMDPAEAAARQQRVARYKEERRRQLAAQYGQRHDTAASSSGSGSGSGGGGLTIRSTRASRLRSAAATQVVADVGKGGDSARRVSASSDHARPREVNGRLGPSHPDTAKEKSPLSDTSSSYGPRRERDKSAKRKSYLNRSLTAEPTPEDALRRQRSVASSSPAQSPAKSPRHTPITAPESDSPRTASARTYKRVTPPRESPKPRPKSSSGLLERQSPSSSPAVPPAPVPEPSPVVNGSCQPFSPSIPDPPGDTAPSLPDVVVLSSPARPSSILKKKSVDESPSISNVASCKPVSILKRKTSQEEGPGAGLACQPVTFSPCVVEPTRSRRQGILKKHRSLDEASVLSRRSVSPDKPILRHQRRSSLEEVRRRTHSPEPQSILKRKTSRDEAVDVSGGSEPQGILKRKTSTTSSGPLHVTIADSVIMAVAGDDALTDDTVRPILKKKTSVCEEPTGFSLEEETPRPILKKKSSSETEDTEEKPKRPILKSRRDSSRVSESRASFTDLETLGGCGDEAPVVDNEVERDVESPSALSARAESCSPEGAGVIRRIPRSQDPDFMLKRRSLDSWVRFKEDPPRVRTSFSVAERVMNMEHFLALEAQEAQRPRSMSPTELSDGKGAVPKRARDRERCRTQPITVQELSNSMSWRREETAAGMQADEPAPHAHALSRSDSVSARASMFEAQLRQKEEDAKPAKPLRGSAARRVKLDPSRFQTQPVTQGEVEEAKRVNEAAKPSSDGGASEDDPNEPSKLSLAERVKLFNQKMVSERLSRSGRHKTQPVTTEEVETAQKLRPISRTASSVLVSGILKNLTEKNDGPKAKNKLKDSSESEEEVEDQHSSQKRGILKSPSQSWRNPKVSNSEERESPSLKSVLKKENKSVEPDRRSKDLHSILKVSRERESSSEETETESEDDKPNANSDLIELLHKVEAQARGERRQSPERRKSSSVINNKLEEPDKLMNLKNLDHGKENYDVTKRIRRRKGDGDLSEGDSSSSGGREVRKIIGNEAVARRRQAGLAREAAERARKGGAGEAGVLSKSRSHSAMNGEVEVALRPPSGATSHPLPLRRCRTQPMDETDEPHLTIAKRLEALQKRGNSDWKKRISKPPPEIELTTTISINDTRQVLKDQLTAPAKPTVDDLPSSTTPIDRRLGQLENSSQEWKKRVHPSDASQYSVAGRMSSVPVSPLPSPLLERKKKVPKPERFRSSKDKNGKDVQSTPTSPDEEAKPGVFKRSISAPGGEEDLSPETVSGPLVSVPSAYDDGFTDFFASTSATTERIELLDEDLETVTNTTSQLLGQRRNIKIQRRHVASTANPLKALAARTDLRTEYVEVKTGVAQREEKRLRVEKLAKHSNLAVEALAGLASQENFAAVQLRSTADSTAHLSPMLPYKELMLLQVKGRRHVQTRLVQPHYTSVNQGDSYVLVTPTQVFHWVGEFSNVIEKSRGAEIAQNIVHTRDLGCGATQVTTLSGAQPHKQFWKLLGADDTTAASYTGAAAGHPDEDELYELALTDTNMVYELQGEELVPRDDCWGAIPKIELLGHNKVLVLDFGSEMYVWMGKTVTVDRRRTALRLAQELWAQGYNYNDCDICPISQAQYLGTRPDEAKKCAKSDSCRPEWALLAKVTQHMETVLLREKFLDWPDFSRVIQVKTSDKSKQSTEGTLEIKPCDAEPMAKWNPVEPDLQLEGSHLGRGTKFYDPETHRHFEISTTSVTVWHVQEFESTELESASVGQLHSGDSYVIRWCYTVTVSGRELNGQPSRHSTVGRDRCAYWTWQGEAASTNDKGAAALLTVQLDQERGPQLRLAQGQEPPAFRQLFGGGLVIHRGRRCDSQHRDGGWRLYLVLGEEANEAVLLEVVCSVRQLRSRACLILLDTQSSRLYLWRGAQALPHTHQVALAAVDQLKERLPAEAGLDSADELAVTEISEGKEPKVFFEALGGSSRQLYVSLTSQSDHTPRLFRLSSVSGLFQATPVTPACHSSQLTTPFPYTQHDLYSARQPALFLFDAGDCLWLWQGWWEWNDSREEEEGSGGSCEVRWQAERRAAMHTALEYGRLRSTTPALLVWAGLEPLTFTNLFPTWTDRDDVAELNIRDGRKPGEVLPVQAELARLTRSTYPPAQLLQRPLPEGVDPTRLEEYLAPQHFQDILGLTKEEFAELPTWKQNKLKQEKGLF